MPSANGFPVQACAQIIYDDDTGDGTTVTTAGTPAILSIAAATAPISSVLDGVFSVDAASGKITALKDCTVLADCSISVAGDEAATQLEVLITKNDARQEGGVARAQVEAAAEPENLSCKVLMDLVKGDEVAVYLDTDTNGDVFTVFSHQLTVLELKRKA